MSGRLRETGWLPENRARLERVIDALAARDDRRVAVFDWDNTMIRGDIGDLVLARMLERDLVRQPPARDWSRLGALTDAARAALSAACDALAEPGEHLPTSRSPACAAAIASIAWNGATPAGEAAFPIPVAACFRASYAFLAQLMAERTEDALRALAREAWQDASARPIGARGDVGGVGVERFARLHAPMIELARALEDVGVEAWIVSASAQPIVEALAEIAGLRRDRVIGVRMPRGEGGVLAHGFEPCGDGALETPVMTWHEGKRWWINRVVFEQPTSQQRARQDDRALRPVFAAGDSDGDLAMLHDATELRVVLDRHQPRVMCSALADPAGWIVQPLFVDPPPPRTEPYPCSSHADELGPIRDEHGRLIPDQAPRRVDESGSA